MANKSYHELTDKEWKRVEKLLPAPKKTGRPQIDSRIAVKGILWILKSGDFLAMGSTFCKVHRHGLGTCKNAPGHETNQEIGSSRGGKTTKIHVLLDEKFHLVKFLLSAGNINDNLVAPALLQGLNLKSKVVLADKAYCDAKIRDYLEKQGARVCIPDKDNVKVKHDFDKKLYKKRNVVERFFCRLKDYLRITIRLDKLSFSFSSFVCLTVFLLSERIHD